MLHIYWRWMCLNISYQNEGVIYWWEARAYGLIEWRATLHVSTTNYLTGRGCQGKSYDALDTSTRCLHPLFPVCITNFCCPDRQYRLCIDMLVIPCRAVSWFPVRLSSFMLLCSRGIYPFNYTLCSIDVIKRCCRTFGGGKYFEEKEKKICNVLLAVFIVHELKCRAIPTIKRHAIIRGNNINTYVRINLLILLLSSKRLSVGGNTR